IDGQARDLASGNLQFPDHELAAEGVAAAPLAGKVEARRRATERKPLRVAVFARLEELALRPPDLQGPAVDTDGHPTRRLLELQLVALVFVRLALADKVAGAADDLQIRGRRRRLGRFGKDLSRDVGPGLGGVGPGGG